VEGSEISLATPWKRGVQNFKFRHSYFAGMIKYTNEPYSNINSHNIELENYNSNTRKLHETPQDFFTER
jgi:hypothetical protein